MQKVLSIDASIRPAQALLVQIGGGDVIILEQHFIPGETDEEVFSNLEELPKQVADTWTNAILFVPGKDHISLNVSLPFKDKKQLSKVVGAEVQDVVPFDIDAFTLHHRHVGSVNGSGEDIHVGLIPKARVFQVLSKTKPVGLDPFIISTPGSSLQGLYELHGESLSHNAGVVLEHPDTIYVAIFIDKKLVLDRSLPRVALSAHQINASIELVLKNAEDRYNTTIMTVYHLCEEISPTVQINPLRTLKALSMMTLFPSIAKKASIVALMGSVFAQDFPAPAILTNFRSGEYSYTPNFSSFVQGLRQLIPYFLTVLFVGTLGLVGVYLVRQKELSTLQAALTAEIKKVIPDFFSLPGEEANMLQRLTGQLEDSLKELGSPLAASPLEVLAAVSEDVSAVEGTTVTRLTIRNGEVRLEGRVANYNTLDKLKSVLKRRKRPYCNVSEPTAGSGESNREFQFNIKLCDQ